MFLFIFKVSSMKKQLTEWKVLELFAVTTWMNQNCSLWIEQSTMTVWALLFEGQSKDGGNFTFETCFTSTRHIQLWVSSNFFKEFSSWKITFPSQLMILFIQVQMAPPIKDVIKLKIKSQNLLVGRSLFYSLAYSFSSSNGTPYQGCHQVENKVVVPPGGEFLP